jgi:hypothetical protein
MEIITLNTTVSPNGLVLNCSGSSDQAATTAWKKLTAESNSIANMTQHTTLNCHDAHSLTFSDDGFPVDFLFVVTQAGSMRSKIAQLTQKFQHFIEQVSTYTDDWRIIVAHGVGGCTNTESTFLTSTAYAEDAAGVTAQFQQAVSACGDSSCYLRTQNLLALARDAINQTCTNCCNEQFSRTDALLHVVVVSDRNSDQRSDRSDGWDQNLGPEGWDQIYQQLVALKGGHNMVKISGFVNDNDGYSEPCLRGYGACGYVQAIERSGGVLLDVTASDWTAALTNLGLAATSLGTYRLQEASASAEQIHAWLNGEELHGENITFIVDQIALAIPREVISQAIRDMGVATLKVEWIESKPCVSRYNIAVRAFALTSYCTVFKHLIDTHWVLLAECIAGR